MKAGHDRFIPLALILLRTIHVLGRRPGGRLYGYEILDQTGMKSGFVYPHLSKLETEGWLTCTKEQADPSAVGRPPRHYYKWTKRGLREYAKLVDRLKAHGITLA